MTERQDDVVRREFAKQASVFGAGGLTLSRQDLLDWIVGELDLRRADTVLDIAAGVPRPSAIRHRLPRTGCGGLPPRAVAPRRRAGTLLLSRG